MARPFLYRTRPDGRVQPTLRHGWQEASIAKQRLAAGYADTPGIPVDVNDFMEWRMLDEIAAREELQNLVERVSRGDGVDLGFTGDESGWRFDPSDPSTYNVGRVR